MKVIVISNPTALNNEAQIINQLFNEGLRYFHLRKPNESEQAIENLLQQIHPSFYSNIALHQHHQMALKFGIKRLHYTEHQRKQTPLTELKKVKSEGFELSTSIHQIESISQLTLFDYIFYGPVFNSISKKDYQSVVPADFRIEKDVNTAEIIALGGITSKNIHKVKAMDFDGFALLGFIWEQPEKAIEHFKSITYTLKYD